MLPRIDLILILIFAISVIHMSATGLERALTVSNSRLASDSSESNDICQPNFCRTGQCISLESGYYCQCPENRYGQRCEKRLKRRQVAKRQSLQELWREMKRNVYRPENSEEEDDGRVYYDFKNGIYL